MLPLCKYHGQNRKRNPIILSKNSIVVTTYNVVASDAFYHSAKGGANYCPPLEMVRWWRIICDEGRYCLTGDCICITFISFGQCVETRYPLHSFNFEFSRLFL